MFHYNSTTSVSYLTIYYFHLEQHFFFTIYQVCLSFLMKWLFNEIVTFFNYSFAVLMGILPTFKFPNPFFYSILLLLELNTSPSPFMFQMNSNIHLRVSYYNKKPLLAVENHNSFPRFFQPSFSDSIYASKNQRKRLTAGFVVRVSGDNSKVSCDLLML